MSFAFSKAPTPFTEVALNWSNDGLETLTPSYVEYTSPQSGATLPLFFDNTNPILRLANLPETQALKGTSVRSFVAIESIGYLSLSSLIEIKLARCT